MTKKTLNAENVLNELKGQSVFFQKPPTPHSPRLKKGTKDLMGKKFRTTELPKSVSSGLTELQTYELRNFAALRRLDVRLTQKQTWFLEEMEEHIRQQKPEGERGNPSSRRITKNAIIRVMVEIFRQLQLPINARRFRNEHDLLRGLYGALQRQLPKLGSSEVPK